MNKIAEKELAENGDKGLIPQILTAIRVIDCG